MRTRGRTLFALEAKVARENFPLKMRKLKARGKVHASAIVVAPSLSLCDVWRWLLRPCRREKRVTRKFQVFAFLVGFCLMKNSPKRSHSPFVTKLLMSPPVSSCSCRSSWSTGKREEKTIFDSWIIENRVTFALNSPEIHRMSSCRISVEREKKRYSRKWTSKCHSFRLMLSKKLHISAASHDVMWVYMERGFDVKSIDHTQEALRLTISLYVCMYPCSMSGTTFSIRWHRERLRQRYEQ